MRRMTKEQTLSLLGDTLAVWRHRLAAWGELRLAAVRQEDGLVVQWYIPGFPATDPVVVLVREDGSAVVGDRVLGDATAALLWLAWEQASWVYDIPQLPELGPLPDDDMSHPA